MPAGPALGQIVAFLLDVEGCCFEFETSSLTSGRFGWLRPRFSSAAAKPLNATYLLRRYLLYQATPTYARPGEHNLLTIVFDQWTCTFARALSLLPVVSSGDLIQKSSGNLAVTLLENQKPPPGLALTQFCPAIK